MKRAIALALGTCGVMWPAAAEAQLQIDVTVGASFTAPQTFLCAPGGLPGGLGLGTLGYGRESCGYVTQVGQIFTAPSSLIESIGFLLWNDAGYGTSVRLQSSIYSYTLARDWLGNPSFGSVGERLWQSGVVSLPSVMCDFFFGCQPPSVLSFSTPGVQLTPDAMYVMFLNWVLGGTGYARVGYHDSNPYAAGGMAVVPLFYGGVLPSANRDLAFRATFTQEAPPPEVVPEPMSLVLLGTGLLGIGLVARRRKKDLAE